MQRLFFLIAALGWLAVPVLAQNQAARQSTTGSAIERTEALPPQPIPVKRLHGYEWFQDEQDLGSLADSLSKEQILRRLSRLYWYQSEILSAQANQEDEQAERLLDLAMTEIGLLAQQPSITERPRYRELYRTIVTEYERYYDYQMSDSTRALAYGSVYTLRADIFAMQDTVEEPLREDVELPTLAPMVTSVPMTQNRIVEQTINYFVEKKRDLLIRWMARADTYFPMIEKIFQEEGIPDELKYLALVESGLNPRARSWAHAVGMWQFIAQTGGAYGLRVNTWVDERMDPEKATRAAARHLRDLYKMYGNNWHVALAGYNCSPRCIKRAISKAGGTMANPPSYWAIYKYLPRETRGYVPQFIAFALIMSNPGSFGLPNVRKGPQYAYDIAQVEGMLSLAEVAEMVDSDEATIKALNPELRRGSLPPNKTAYPLRIPPGTYAQFADAFDDLPQEAKRPVSEYVVRRGDSLGKIANKYGVSVSGLKQANNLRRNTIHPGQRLVVPVPSYRGPVSLAATTATSVDYGTRTIRPIKASLTLAANTESTPVVRTSESTPKRSSSSTAARRTSTNTESGNRVVYKVRRGDTLGKIARKYGTSVSKIKAWNNIRGTKIRSGQRLTIYASGKAQPERVVYKVRRGDTLSKIAQKYGVSVRSIKQWNNLSGTKIRSGQRLTIHPGQTAPKYVVYKVRRGDSLGKIARKYGTSVSKIKSWNSLRGSTIHPGQRLKIYP